MTRVKAEELGRHLREGLRPVYLVAGDEPLLVDEALARLRAQAAASGFTEREVLDAEAGFDWNQLQAASASLSLFADRRLIELRLAGGKAGQAGAKAISEYCDNAPDDVLLLINAGALEPRQRKAAWVEAVARAGAVVEAWPVPPRELPGWITDRMERMQLQPTEAAAALLAERAEGNLLAAVQEIEKLRLIHGAGAVDAEAVRAAVAETARFDVFDLADAALGGDVDRVLRIARGLREAGSEPTLVLWALAKELRVLVGLAVAGRGDAQAVFQQHRVWKRRQGLFNQAVQRAPAAHWERLLARAARIDRINKGAATGRAWDELIQLAVSMARSRRAA